MQGSRRIRVLGFDGWTAGVHHFTRLLGAFADRKIELRLVHLGSWGDEPGRPESEIIEGLEVRDIKHYAGSLQEVLDREAPDVALLLSTETFAHRAFLRHCAERGIPTINLYHGLVGVLPDGEASAAYRLNFVGQIRNVAKLGGKAIRFAFPTYAWSLWTTRAKPRDWRRFGEDIVRRAMGRTIAVPAPDAQATRCCVYTNADVRDAKRRFGYDDRSVTVVGNPDLIRFGIAKEMFGSRLNRDDNTIDTLLYIDSGISSYGYNFRSDRAYARFLQSCATALSRHGLGLSVKVKPHPASRFELVCESLRNAGIEVVDNRDLLAALSRCRGCIAEPSTLSLIPALLGMRLLLPKVGPLATLEYGRVFREYPRAAAVYRWSDLRTLLNEESPSVAAVQAWIDENAGPLPASLMPERVADVVADVACEVRR